MASRAAHPLAREIAELVAPPRKPTLLHLHASGRDRHPLISVVLHVHPQRLSAGLEVAVHSGVLLEQQSEYSLEAHISRGGLVFAVPQTAAGIAAFTADLVACTGELVTEESSIVSLELPAQHSEQASWHRISLSLYDAGSVRSREEEPRAHWQPWWHVLEFPVGVGDSLVGTAVTNESAAYAERQLHLARQRSVLQPAAAAAGPAAAASAGVAVGPAAKPAEEPDSQDDFQRKFGELRKQAMDSLVCKLSALLRLAVSYRGTAGLPAPAAQDMRWDD
ncbi:hypothetical protein ABPG75_004059 [Micractinium tetrahymenae]